eukprot:953954-Rhodomonas_salina.3
MLGAWSLLEERLSERREKAGRSDEGQRDNPGNSLAGRKGRIQNETGMDLKAETTEFRDSQSV